MYRSAIRWVIKYGDRYVARRWYDDYYVDDVVDAEQYFTEQDALEDCETDKGEVPVEVEVMVTDEFPEPGENEDV